MRGTTLLQVQARSTDTGLNNVIRYKISNGGANNELFVIHPVTGKLNIIEEVIVRLKKAVVVARSSK